MVLAEAVATIGKGDKVNPPERGEVLPFPNGQVKYSLNADSGEKNQIDLDRGGKKDAENRCKDSDKYRHKTVPQIRKRKECSDGYCKSGRSIT